MTKFLSYYGDDFTGSTDVMEALATHGVETVLFTRMPSETEFAPFARCAAIGLAGTSRSQSPAWMDEHLPKAFAWLKSLGARYCHYKVCSTFDSSPPVGNIGRAAEIGLRVFGQRAAPLVAGAPQLKRYTFAGHLFAGYRGEIHRIDRHPVMARHPVTPMDEADLRLHLARQTALPVILAGGPWPDDGLMLLDVHDAATQLEAGRQLLDAPSHGAPFVIGSSGVEYALLAALHGRGEVTRAATFAPLKPAAPMIAVSGSVSPTTERQIRHAEKHGFSLVPVPAVDLANGAPIDGVIAEALRALSSGATALVHTALGAATDQSQTLDAIPDGRRRVGEALGLILRGVIERADVKRAIIAGGDSSSHALGQLDIHALRVRFPLAATPGSPLCVASSKALALDGLEIALKGGQVGADDYFTGLRDGTAS